MSEIPWDVPRCTMVYHHTWWYFRRKLVGFTTAHRAWPVPWETRGMPWDNYRPYGAGYVLSGLFAVCIIWGSFTFLCIQTYVCFPYRGLTVYHRVCVRKTSISDYGNINPGIRKQYTRKQHTLFWCKENGIARAQMYKFTPSSYSVLSKILY